MNKKLLFLLMLCSCLAAKAQDKFIARQGQVTFFSYTSVENIQATNNQTLSLIDIGNNEIAVSILMRAFVFEKSLMQEHFNESYIESDLYPKASFDGKIIDFDPSFEGIQTRMIEGVFTLRNSSKELLIKADISKQKNTYIISGEFEVYVKDYEIRIPSLLSPNIANTIKVSFNFQYESYEN